MEYEILVQILFETALTLSVYSVKVPKKKGARYLALFWRGGHILGYLEAIYPQFRH